MTTTISSKGQITIPKAIRDKLGLTEGMQCNVYEVGGRIELVPKNVSVWSLRGMLKSPHKRPITVEEMDEAIARAVWEDHERIRKGLESD